MARTKTRTQASNWFLPDEAIKSTNDDRLGHHAFAKVVVEAIASAKPPATIGLLGGFGVGKSSIGNLVRAELSTDDRFDVIRVSADKHAADARARNLVHSVAAEVESITNDSREIKRILMPLRSATSHSALDPTDTAATRIADGTYAPEKIAWSAALWLFAPIAALAVVIIFAALRGGKDMAAIAVLALLGLLAIARQFFTAESSPFSIKRLYEPGKRDISYPRAEAADDVEIVFSKVIEFHHKKRKRTLVIFVDDIDRLSSDDLLDALRSIRSLQAVPRGCEPIFVLACSEEIVLDAIKTQADREGLSGEPTADGSSRDDAAHAFLDKLLTARIPLPPAVQSNMRRLANELVSDDHPVRGRVEDVEQISRVLVHLDVNDPRSVIRLWNRFFAAYLTGQEREASGHVHAGDVTSHPVMLAKLCVLYDEFPDFYQAIVRNESLLSAADRLSTGQTPSEAHLTEALRHAQVLLDNESIEDLVEASRSDPDLLSRRFSTLGGRKLVRYLGETARTVKYPPHLAPLLLFAQAPEQSKLGGERYQSLRRALQGGDTAALASDIADLDSALHGAAADVLIDTIANSDRYDAENVVAAAAAALDALQPAQATRVADATVDLARRHQQRSDIDSLQKILTHASDAMHQGLCGLLTDRSADADVVATNLRYLAAFHTADELPATALYIIPSIEAWLAELPVLGGWSLVDPWIVDMVAVDINRHRPLIADSVLPAALKMVVSGVGITLERADQIADLARDADVEASTVEAEIARWEESTAACELTVRLASELDLSATPDVAYLVAATLADNDATGKARHLAIDYLADHVDQWSGSTYTQEASDGEGKPVTEEADLGLHVAESLSSLIESESAEMVDRALQRLPDIRTGLAQAHHTVVLDALSEYVTARWEEQSELGNKLAAHSASSLVELAEHSPGDDAARILDLQMASIETGVDPADPKVSHTLRLIPSMRYAQGREALKRLVQRCTAAITTQPKQDHRAMLAALIQVDALDPALIDEAAKETYPTIEQQLTSNPALERQWEVLALYPWPTREAPRVAKLLEAHTGSIPEHLLTDTLQQLIKLPSEQELPDVLADRLITATEQAPTSQVAGVAAALWPRLSPQHRDRVASAAALRHEAVRGRFVHAAPDVAAGIVARADVDASQLLSLRDDSASVARAVLEELSTEQNVSRPAIAAAVAALDNTQRSETAARILDQLPAPLSTSKLLVESLNLLRSAGAEVDPGVQDDKTAELLPDADAELAASLGSLANGRHLRKTDDLLKGRDGLRKSKPTIAEAFDNARSSM